MISISEAHYANRRNKIIKLIPGEAALFSAGPELFRNWGESVPYRQNADFFYLTGFEEPDAVLFLRPTASTGTRKSGVKTRNNILRSILFLRESDAHKERWEGPVLGISRAKRRFDVDEVRNISALSHDLPKLLQDTSALHYAAGTNPKIDSLIWSLFQSRVGPRLDFPRALKDARLLTSEMRFVKDQKEIALLRRAAEITAEGFRFVAPQLRRCKSEIELAKLIESSFARLGADNIAFPTIIASGSNATCLHHTPQRKALSSKAMVLIDAGASFFGYAGDISRTLPVSGKFSTAQAEAYDVVLSAVKAAIRIAKPGSTLNVLHKAAVTALTKGLIELGILKGNVSKLISKEQYKNYFMHRTGHWLGLDVHDISPLYTPNSTTITSSLSRPFVPGNVFTVEPGLYFDETDTSVPKHFRGLGIRLEEDILITKSGCEVLSWKMPVGREEVEAVMRDSQ